MASDSDAVHSYCLDGLRLWAERAAPHGPLHDCCICADTRAYLGWPALARNHYDVMVAPNNEEKERSA